MTSLLELLNKLSVAGIHNTVRHSRHDAVMVEIAVPGERWEIDFLVDGSVEVEVFKSTKVVSCDPNLIEKMIARQSS